MSTNVVIVDQTKDNIDPGLLSAAAVALNVQVTQHLPKYWNGISANVSTAPSIGVLPANSWPVFLVKALPPGEGGFHMDKHNQPYAKVIASPSDPSWTIDASHEIIEMLVDPYGNRMQTSQAITIKGDTVVDAPGTFDYLVEACDPCEAVDFAYDIDGIEVSDFITPDFYDAAVRSGTQYSYMGHITRPRQLLKGGYISYIGANSQWQQILWVDPSGPPTYNNELAAKLGLESVCRSWREAVHSSMGVGPTKAKFAERRKRTGLDSAVAARLSQRRSRDPKEYEASLKTARGWQLD